MNALVLSHLHYPLIILNSITKSLTSPTAQLGNKIVLQSTEIRLIAQSQNSISCFTDPILSGLQTLFLEAVTKFTPCIQKRVTPYFHFI